MLLLCDACDNACHLTCCNPPLKRVPKGDWFCVECLAKRAPVPTEAARWGRREEGGCQLGTGGREAGREGNLALGC